MVKDLGWFWLGFVWFWVLWGFDLWWFGGGMGESFGWISEKLILAGGLWWDIGVLMCHPELDSGSRRIRRERIFLFGVVWWGNGGEFWLDIRKVDFGGGVVVGYWCAHVSS
ncbi:MAG: hypothetical protein JW855_03060 [Gammaproteobacteria bacterium]|nr:hypothetical protein [Gammaproteobacteria bacterium]